MQSFTIVAKTLAGLEEILAGEVQALGASDIVIGTRMVSYQGDKQLLYKSNLWLRTALRILKPVEAFEASDPDDLYQQVLAIDWSKYVAEGQTIAIDNTIYSDNFRNSRYAIYRAKDAICDWFVQHDMKRPRISVGSADVQLNLHITDEGASSGKSLCQISLDSSGDALYKRGYKEQLTDAPISEVLAAGILLKAGWDGSRDLIDPMCGSGTFLIEAALIATNTPAGIYRKGYGFERWTVGENAFDAELWQSLYDDDSQERPFLHHIWGSDISKVAIEATAQNVRAAGLSKYITLEVNDFENYQTTVHPALAAFNAKADELRAEGSEVEMQAPMLVFNPPYGRRLFTDIPTFYHMMGAVLKNNFSGCEAWIISSDEQTFSYTDPRTGQRRDAEPFEFIGLKPSLRIELNNGGLSCQLRKYEMFKGRFNDFRAEGNQLDRKSSDQKSEMKFQRQEHAPKKASGKSADGKKPFKKDSAEGKKPFRKDRDGKKPFARTSAPRRTSDSSTERSYTVQKDGTVVARKPFADSKPVAQKSSDGKKPFKKDFGGKKSSAKPVEGKKPFQKPAERKPRRREYDPNRPMFGPDFDMSKAVLDYTQTDKK